jgi:hypothetical protein
MSFWCCATSALEWRKILSNMGSPNSLLKIYLIMKRLRIFFIILTISIGVLLGLIAISVYLAVTAPSDYQSSWMGQMWQSIGFGGHKF